MEPIFRLKMPIWYRVAVGIGFALMLTAFVLLRDPSAGRLLAQPLMDDVVRRLSPIARMPSPPALLDPQPSNGAYIVNGMRVQYAYRPQPDSLDDTFAKFREGFEKTGYVHRTITMDDGTPVLMAIHPETKVALMVRPEPGPGGVRLLRLSQLNLGDVKEGFKPEIPGIPAYPGATGSVLVQYAEATTLMYTTETSPSFAARFYTDEMARSGWRRDAPPVTTEASELSTLFFRTKDKDCSVIVMPNTADQGSIVFLTITPSSAAG